MNNLHNVRFPGESAAYRAARNALLEAEIKLRKQIEQLARKQALVVDQQFLLYPTIIDKAAINSARVEAMMRKSQLEPVDEEKIMSTFYLELNPSSIE